MAATETHTDAIARVYAASLFELADAKGGQSELENVGAQLEDIIELTKENPRFAEFLSSQILSADKRRDSIRSIFNGRCSDLVLRFLLVCNDKGRLNKLSGIAAAYDSLLQERYGRVEVDVFTAAGLDSRQLDALKDRLKSAIGKEPVIHAYTDPSLIGGMKLLIGDQLIDASVANRLRRMSDRLATSGAPEIRSRAARIFES
ncbi:MAG: ATP synthase F1 subunit delta [Phycisphaeraceae bacterium]|nr:ATP synthase F1 subunit delta [Phycisphaeraceae bacterium]